MLRFILVLFIIAAILAWPAWWILTPHDFSIDGTDWDREWHGFGYTAAQHILTRSDGVNYVVGYFNGYIDFDPGIEFDWQSAGFKERELRLFIARYDSDGNYLGVKTFDNYWFMPDIELDSQGNLCATGYVKDYCPFDHTIRKTTPLENDFYIAKLDRNLETSWIVTWTLKSTVEAIVKDLYVDSSDNIWLLEKNFRNNTMFHYLRKFDSGGRLLNEIIWEIPLTNLGSEEMQRSFLLLRVASDADGNAYLLGEYVGEVNLDPYGGPFAYFSAEIQPFIIKIDPLGHTDWVRKATYFNNQIYVGDENFYTAGITQAGKVGSEEGIYNLSKYSFDGTLLWERTWNTRTFFLTNSESIQAIDSGEIITTGYFMRSVELDPGDGEHVRAGPVVLKHYWSHNGRGRRTSRFLFGGFVNIFDVDGNWLGGDTTGRRPFGISIDSQGRAYVITNDAGELFSTISRYTFEYGAGQ